ncbi:DUF2281 domain-containing protein [Caldisalinibacter kiritimatiensis]|uniref:DUF2281 domain-containing protein n=1 Tax=Caldisalinibacter kiritimatiensis TaxID=1304284 RepID=R1CST3_9FIRM|nr:DUF2281 domain-containing protein [Caldisalinibacter kiritimatiensis]EOD01716.1 hypothetical protein L21TH_0202 [Caldisalinibacter kiritimatiensis]
MINRETIVKKIEKLPPHLLQEVADYIDFIIYKRSKYKNFKVDDITLASEKSLAKDWLRPEEDEAWEDL